MKKLPGLKRLQNYDYTQPAAYFITVVTHERKTLFGQINKGKVILSHAGNLVRLVWLDLAQRFPYIELDLFCVMPNHFHGIIIYLELENKKFENKIGGLGLDGKQHPNRQPINQIYNSNRFPLSEVIRIFKASTSRGVNRLNKEISPLWQRNFYEHVVRNEDDLERIREYILNNPINWDMDEENRSK